MIIRFAKIAFVAALLMGAVVTSYSQSDVTDSAPGGRGRRPPESADFKSMLAKQRLERDKRDHREMLERGEQALRLANQLEASFNTTKNISSEDRIRLESLQEVVEKIRKELGGDDDEDGAYENEQPKAAEENRPSTVEEALKYLQTTTVKLVDELKKTTRFTISAIAIQSTNNVLRLVKFLRFRK